MTESFSVMGKIYITLSLISLSKGGSMHRKSVRAVCITVIAGKTPYTLEITSCETRLTLVPLKNYGS
jgi:hypothetical protein